MDIHILETRTDQAEAVFHITVPDVNNTAGISYRTALAEYNLAHDVVQQIPGLADSDPVEYAAIDAGQVYEEKVIVRYSAHLSNVEKKQAIEAEYSARKSAILAAMQKRLEFWRMAWDVEV